MAANRYPWVRAALCCDATSARLSREHNDANVIAFGERLIGVEVAKEALRAFLQTPFDGARHTARVQKTGTQSAERRVGKEGVRTGRSRWTQYKSKKKKDT